MIEVDLQLRLLRELLEDEPIFGINKVIFEEKQYERIMYVLKKLYRLRTMEIREKANVSIYIADLAKEIGLSACTVSSYIGNYRFCKYIPTKSINPNTRLNIDTDFIKSFYEYLMIRKKENNAIRLKEWWDKDKRK